VIDWIVGIALIMICQFVYYCHKHKDDGGGQDGNIGSAILSLGVCVIGLAMLALCALYSTFTGGIRL
jgi:hypothetical protein